MTVSGYASKTSVLQGDSIKFHLSTDSPGLINLTVERVGTTSISAPIAVTLAHRSPPVTNPWEGFGWPVSASFSVPSTWSTGLYKLVEGGSAILSFVVLPKVAGQNSKVLFHLSFLTSAAYNPAGGKSLYGFNSGSGGEDERATKVSLDRPFDGGIIPTGLGPESTLIGWLENEGIAIEYCSSIDLHANPSLLSSYDCLVLAYHDEYWTKEMRDQAEQFIKNGGNVVVLSGNTCFRAVRLEQEDRLVVFYKYAGNDPNLDSEKATVAWAEPPLSRPPNSFLGVGFTEGAFNAPPNSPAEYKIRFPLHWVFDGISASATSPFMTYETDAAAYVDEPEGYPRVTGEEDTPLAFTVLASADLRSWIGVPGQATMGIYSRNGTVFNAATTDWVNVLDTDPVVAQVTRNVFSRLKQRVVPEWEDVGHAISGSALTALENKLFIATTENLLWRRYPVGADALWANIGEANNFIAMAGSGNTLFGVTNDNQFWWRSLEENTDWMPIGTGIAGGTKAIAAAGGMLYAVDATGALWRTPATRSNPSWVAMTAFAGDSTVNAMTSYSDILFASTTDNRLLRSNRDLIDESTAWKHFHSCPLSVGLAVVEWMLFLTTTDERLLRLDIYGLRNP